MTHVLVVHHDLDMADQESDWLRHAGFSVEQCAGPQYGPCPVLHGGRARRSTPQTFSSTTCGPPAIRSPSRT